MKSTFSIAILLLAITVATVVGKGLRGSEFWFGYALSSDWNGSLLIAIVTESPGIACIHFSNLTNCINIEPGMSNTYDIDKSMEGSNFIIESKGIMVNATVEINVFVLNYNIYASDGFAVLPVSQLSTKYVITTGPPSVFFESEFFIVSPFDNNEVNITLESQGSFTYQDINYTKGDVLKLQLNKFETFQIAVYPELSGTSIKSSKYVAVISGVPCYDNPPGVSCNGATEMMLPIQAFSYDVIIPIFQGQESGLLYVMASSDNTEVVVDGIFHTVNANQYVNTSINVRTPTSVSSTNGVLVSLFIGWWNGFMITIPGVNQYRHEYNFIAFDSFTSYLSVIIQESSNASNILLDGNTITYLQQTSVVMNNSTRYTICTLSVTAGVHTMNHTTQERFGLFVYGAKSYNGYGYTADINIAECASNPCQNGATCNDLVNSFNCSCAPGYSDTNCSTEIDECASAPCQNGGTCTDKVNGFNCTCPAGYSGYACEADVSRGVVLEFTLAGEGYVINEETRQKAIVLLETIYSTTIVSVPWFISVEDVSISLGSLIIAHTLVAREIPDINFIVAAAVDNITGREVRLDNESSSVVVEKVFLSTLNITADVSSTACDVLSIIQPCNSGEACYQDNVGIPVCSETDENTDEINRIYRKGIVTTMELFKFKPD